MTEVIVGSKIIIKNATPGMEAWAKHCLTIDNPEYYKKERMGYYVGNIEKSFSLYEHKYVGHDHCLVLPFGVLGLFYRTFSAWCTFYPLFGTIERLDYKSNVNLYPYQSDAVEAILKAKNGIVVMPCGAGKTQTGLEAIARIGGRTLWLTHTQDLLNQSMNRAKSVYGIDASDYGTITEGKVNVGKLITFATVQTMANIDLNSLRDCFDVIVVDECHKAIGTPSRCMMFYKVLSALRARYKIGLTATPERADGLEACMYALLGEKIIEIDKSAVAERTCKVKVRFVDTGFIPDNEEILDTDGTIMYQKLIENLVEDDTRLNVVANEIGRIPPGAPTLILANRVEYLRNLRDECYRRSGGKLRAICLSGAGTSKKAKQERKNALTDLNEGRLDCIFATYQLAKEGLDVPNLRYLVLATPEKNKTTVTQSAGRVSRVSEGKDHGTIIDFVDDFPMYKGWRSKRIKYYKDLGYEICSFEAEKALELLFKFFET